MHAAAAAAGAGVYLHTSAQLHSHLTAGHCFRASARCCTDLRHHGLSSVPGTGAGLFAETGRICRVSCTGQALQAAPPGPGQSRTLQGHRQHAIRCHADGQWTQVHPLEARVPAAAASTGSASAADPATSADNSRCNATTCCLRLRRPSHGSWQRCCRFRLWSSAGIAGGAAAADVVITASASAAAKKTGSSVSTESGPG